MTDLTEEERLAVIAAIHLAQDMYAGSSDDLAQQEHEEDRAAGREAWKRVELLDSARRKLGDTWEPDPAYRAPDSPEGIIEPEIDEK